MELVFQGMHEWWLFLLRKLVFIIGKGTSKGRTLALCYFI